MGTIFDREHEPPEPTTGDTAYAVVHATMSLVPGAAILQLILAPPLARRQSEWMEDMAAAVRRLECGPRDSARGAPR